MGSENCALPGRTRPDIAVFQRLLAEMCATAQGKRFALRVSLGTAPTIGQVLKILVADQRPDSCRLTTIVTDGNTNPPWCNDAVPLATAISRFPATATTKTTREIIEESARLTKILNEFADLEGGFLN